MVKCGEQVTRIRLLFKYRTGKQQLSQTNSMDVPRKVMHTLWRRGLTVFEKIVIQIGRFDC